MAGLVGVVVLVGSGLLAGNTELDSLPVGQDGGAAPGFELENLRPDRPGVSLGGARGKPVVLNFWASWCVPCRREMPSFQAVHAAMKDRVTFLGVNHQDQRGPALALLAETGVGYPSGYDPAGDVALDYGLQGMPTTIFISAGGRVVGRRTGEMSRTELEEAIDQLLSG